MKHYQFRTELYIGHDPVAVVVTVAGSDSEPSTRDYPGSDGGPEEVTEVVTVSGVDLTALIGLETQEALLAEALVHMSADAANDAIERAESRRYAEG